MRRKALKRPPLPYLRSQLKEDTTLRRDETMETAAIGQKTTPEKTSATSTPTELASEKLAVSINSDNTIVSLLYGNIYQKKTTIAGTGGNGPPVKCRKGILP